MKKADVPSPHRLSARPVSNRPGRGERHAANGRRDTRVGPSTGLSDVGGQGLVTPPIRGGFVFPTHRAVYPTDEHGRKVAEPVIISIDLPDITLS
jgi:hypothetical protein